MKLNLGCGKDKRPGYLNVDFIQPCDQLTDLSVLPWPWSDSSIEEVLMLDFLEHFTYHSTTKIIQECWRVLQPGGRVDVQVPDFEHCSVAAMGTTVFQCNRCGCEFHPGQQLCSKCKQSKENIQDAAIHRLYGGQDRPGNWHYTAFTKEILTRFLLNNGFEKIEVLEHLHQRANWNIKLSAQKGELDWSEQ